MTLLLLAVVAVTPAADLVTWPVPSRELEGGGRVELVAIGDDAGTWWTPTGEPIADPPFRLAPHYFTDEARKAGRETNFDADAAKGEVERVFVVRILNADPEAVLSVRPTSVRDPKTAVAVGGTSIAVNHDVTDRDGQPLTNWKANASVFFKGRRPTGTQVVVEHGPWLHELSDKPETISQKEHDRDVAEQRVVETKEHGTATYRLEVIEHADGRSRLFFHYSDRDHSRAGRFVVHFSDGETLTTSGGTGIVGATELMYQTLTPIDRADIKSVDIELRPADTATFEDVSIHPSEAAE